MSDKRCPRCGQYKPRTEFNPRPEGGVMPYCIPCQKAYASIAYVPRGYTRRAPKGSRICPCCGEIKPSDEYRKLPCGRYTGACVACRKIERAEMATRPEAKPLTGGGPQPTGWPIYRGTM